MIERLGESIEQERKLREEAERGAAGMRTEYERVAADHGALLARLDEETRRAAHVERRIQEAETTLDRVRKDAEVLINAADSYQTAKARALECALLLLLDWALREELPRQGTELQAG